MNWPWSELGLDGPASLSEIRHAYAQRLKETHPELDPEGFQRLHRAYQEARRIGKRQPPQQMSSSTQAPPQKPNANTSAEQATAQPAFLEFDEHTEQQSTPNPSSAPKENKQDWNYTELFAQDAQQTEAQNAAPNKIDTQSEAWDFDELIEQSTPKPTSAPKENKQDWNYTELFAQDDKQRTAARQKRYSVQNKEEDWKAVDAAMQMIYTLFIERRPPSDWMQFLSCGVFFRVKGSPLFLSELAAFFMEHFTIDQGVKRTFLNAYGLNQMPVPAIYCPLYEALTGTKIQSAEAVQKKQRKILVIVWTGILAILLVGIFLSILPDLKLERTYQTLSTYIEKDFGCPVAAVNKMDTEQKQFAPLDAPNLHFRAWLDGVRNPQNGKLGYGTNFGDALAKQKLEDFADERSYALFEVAENYDSAEKAAFYGVMPVKYYLELPFSGAENSITELGKLLNDIQQEPWFKIAPPSFELHLSYDNISYYKCKWPTEPFETEKIRRHYETQVPFALGRYVIKQSGLGETEFGSTDYILKNLGTSEYFGKLYYLIAGAQSETSPIRYIYLYNGTSLYSVKAEEFDETMRDKHKFLMGDRFISKSKTSSHSVLIYQLSE